MERIMSVEDRIKRAEELYYRKKQNENSYNNYARVQIKSKKDYRILKKLVIQIISCLVIYFIFYYIVNNNYVFSEDFRKKAKEILAYDINIGEIYNNSSNCIKDFIKSNKTSIEKKDKKEDTEEEKEDNLILEVKNTENINEQTNKEESEGNNVTDETSQQENTSTQENIDNTTTQEENIPVQENENIGGAEEETQNLSQMEQDCIDIKNITSFIVPVQGYVSSTFGLRNPTTSTVPKNHTGLDIAAITGTEIKSATNGTVILASSEGDYGNHLKIKLEDIVIIYAHCSVLNVKEGDSVVQGQKIAEVGSTGNSTGPHLHFEVRKSERLVDPQMLMEI